MAEFFWTHSVYDSILMPYISVVMCNLFCNYRILVLKVIAMSGYCDIWRKDLKAVSVNSAEP